MKRRIIALLTAAMLLMAICPAALAEPETTTPPPAVTGEKDIILTVGSPIAGTGIAYIPVTITNKGNAAIELKSITTKEILFGKSISSEKPTVAPGASTDILLTPAIRVNAAGTYADLLSFKFSTTICIDNEGNGVTGDVTISANVTMTLGENGGTTPSPDPSQATAAFRLSSYDPNGLIVTTASGKNGGKVLVRLPLMCVSGPVMNIKVAPKLSTSLDEFPFAIERVDYTVGYNGFINANQIIEFQFDMRFADKVTAGFIMFYFSVTYSGGGGCWLAPPPKAAT